MLSPLLLSHQQACFPQCCCDPSWVVVWESQSLLSGFEDVAVHMDVVTNLQGLQKPKLDNQKTQNTLGFGGLSLTKTRFLFFQVGIGFLVVFSGFLLFTINVEQQYQEYGR